MIGIVELVVAIVLLGSVDTRFEKLLISLLVMTYATVRLSGATLGLTTWEQAAIGLTRYIHILKLMRDPDYQNSREYVDADASDANEKLRKGTITIRIRSIVLDIMAIIALIFLLIALFY